MNRLPLCTAALLCAGLSAQNLAYFPSDHDPAVTPEGSSLTSQWPYAYGVSRVMLVYEAWDLHVPAGHAIDRIGFRSDGTRLSYGQSLFLEVRMGRTDRTAATCDYTFDTNYLSPPTTVFGPAVFVMPDMNNVLNPNPDGNMIWLNLTTPFTPDPSHNLVVEFRVLSNNNGGASFTYYLDVGTYVSPKIDGQQVCAHTGGSTAELHSRGVEVGGTWYSDLTRAPSGQPSILFVSVGGTLQAPLPLNLILPGVQPSCSLQLPLNSLFSLGGTTNNSGSFTWSVPIPNSRLAWNDTFLTTQVLCADFFSPGGFVVSNATQMQIGIDPAMSMIFTQSSATAPTGSLYRNFGLVTTFRYQ